MEYLSDKLLARIVALAADAIICINAQRRITFFNDGASRIFGYTAEEILGCDLDLLIPPRFANAHNAHIDEFGRSPVVARQMGERSLISGLRKNGEEFPAEAAITKMVVPEGYVFSVVLRDVTLQRSAEAQNRRLLADTEMAVKARDEVLALVSHDLRNPVNAVKMLASAILRIADKAEDSPLPAQVVEHSAVMLQAATQMDALIQDLLDVTRLESGKLQIIREPVVLEDAVRAMRSTLRPIAEERGTQIHTEIPDSIPLLAADHARLVQLLSNLVSNAIKFSPLRSVVRVTATCDAEYVRVAVSDDGVGIATEELPLVFDRFWQSRRTNRSGAGLGLAIARGIVRAHGGDITVESEHGRGTTVHFTVPIYADSVDETA